ncbi:MAG: hypothetical protein AAB895_03685 [Patescibacteria group bacterium]
MEQNNVYNLMHQLTQESKSLWRIQHNYLNESVTEEEKTFWIKVAAEKESLIKELRVLLTSHINA